MNNQEVQIYSAPQPKKDFFTWANFIWLVITAVIAVGGAWFAVKIKQSETDIQLANFQAWAREQKAERDEKIATEKRERIAGDDEIKNTTVSKDEMKGINEILQRIEGDTTYMRGRIDDLEIRKKNN